MAVLPELVDGSQGLVTGDRNYWSPRRASGLAVQGISLEASSRTAKKGPWPQRSRFLSHLRYRIDTVFGQLVERYRIKRSGPGLAGTWTVGFCARFLAIRLLSF